MLKVLRKSEEKSYKKTKLTDLKNKLIVLSQSMTRFSSIYAIKSKWIDLMTQLGCYNLNLETYGLNYVELTDYGWSATIKVPLAMTYDDFLNLKDHIETAFGARLVANNKMDITHDIKDKSLIDIELISVIDYNKHFTGIKLNNITDVCIGQNYLGENILLDFAVYPHLLLCGLTRQGKTKLMQLILLSLSQNFKKEEVEFWIFQVDKADMAMFEECKNTVKFVERDYESIKEVLQELMVEVDRRISLMRPYMKNGTIDNFLDYNKIATKKLPAIYVAVDEIASLAQKGDSSTKKIREDIELYLNYIVTKGASSGVYFITSVQRPDIESLKSTTRSQCANIVSFRAANDKSSEVCTDDNKLATDLSPREFVYKNNNKWSYGIVPLIDKKEILKQRKGQ